MRLCLPFTPTILVGNLVVPFPTFNRKANCFSLPGRNGKGFEGFIQAPPHPHPRRSRPRRRRRETLPTFMAAVRGSGPTNPLFPVSARLCEHLQSLRDFSQPRRSASSRSGYSQPSRLQPATVVDLSHTAEFCE